MSDDTTTQPSSPWSITPVAPAVSLYRPPVR